MLTAFEQYSVNNKSDADINKELVINFIKNVTAFTNGKGELVIAGPQVPRSRLLELFGDEKPVEAIVNAYKKDDGEEEGDKLVDTLMALVADTPALKVYSEFAAAAGFSADKLLANLNTLLRSVLKDSDISSHISIKSDGDKA